MAEISSQAAGQNGTILNEKGIVEQELGRSVSEVGQEWIARTEGLSKKPRSGH